MVVLSAGFSMEMVAVGYLVYDLTNSALLLGVVEMGFAIPTLALGLLGGVVADRFDRKYVIQACQATEVAVALGIAALILTDRIHWTHLAAMAMIEGSLFSFMMPARQAIIPQLVDRAQLTSAMAINAAAFSATTLLSPAVAGGLYALVGPGGVFLAIMSLKAVAVLITARVPRIPPDRTGEPRPVARDIKDGLAYVRRTNVVLVLLVFTLVVLLTSWPFHTLIPVFVVDVYHLGPRRHGVDAHRCWSRVTDGLSRYRLRRGAVARATAHRGGAGDRGGTVPGRGHTGVLCGGRHYGPSRAG